MELTKYQTTATCKGGRTWYTEKWVIENLGPEVLVNMKTDTDMVEGITHKKLQRQVWSTTQPSTIELRPEWGFSEEVIELVRKELAYDRMKRRHGRYKVNGKDYPGYVMCFIVRGEHLGMRRLVIAHANNYTTYLNTRKRTIIDAIIFCKKIDSPNRKFFFQTLHEHCDKFLKEEPSHMSSRAMFDVYFGLKPADIPVVTKPPSEHTYLVPQRFFLGHIKKFMEEQITTLKEVTTKRTNKPKKYGGEKRGAKQRRTVRNNAVDGVQGDTKT